MARRTAVAECARWECVKHNNAQKQRRKRMGQVERLERERYGCDAEDLVVSLRKVEEHQEGQGIVDVGANVGVENDLRDELH